MQLQRKLGTAAVLFSLVSASAAQAETTAADRAASEALFNEGKRLVAAGDYAAACPKFAESNRLDPAPGTLLNLGDCLENIGKTASAWGTFNQVEIVARQEHDTKGRIEEGARRAKLLEPKLSSLVIEVPQQSRIAGLEVRRDDQALGEGSWGTAIPVDPGTHTVEAKAPGMKGWSGRVEVEAKPGITTISVPLLVAPPPPITQPVSGWTTQRKIAVGLGGVGVAGVVIGAVFGAQAAAKSSDLDAHCQPGSPRRCDAQGITLHGDGLTAANVSNVAFAAGGAALIAGGLLFLLGPSPAKEPAKPGSALRVELGPTVTGAAQGIWIRGAW